MKRLKVILVLDYAPDYRESFLRELSSRVDLTVVAQPCEGNGLISPDTREGYQYVELSTQRLGGFYWQPKLLSVLHRHRWDVLCVDMNMRHLTRLVAFVLNSTFRNKWVWRGHVFGRNDWKVLALLKKYCVRSGAGCLAYSEAIAARVSEEFGADAVSFNNTQIRKNDFRTGTFGEHPELRFLFVGRNQPRKRLQRLVSMAERWSCVHVRLIGPGMDSLQVTRDLKESGRVKRFGRMIGDDLNVHFDWADVVANPGHVGLLVMNAAQHGKGIVIDSDSQHAPEYWLAKEARQPFICFQDMNDVSRFIKDVKQNRWKWQQWGGQLQGVAKAKYTIEFMAAAHVGVFESINALTERKCS